MDVKKQIKSFLNQAEIYKSQGLLRDAREKYIAAGKLIQKNYKIIGNYKSLLETIAQKVEQVKKDIYKEDNAPVTQEMPKQVQEIIKAHFAFSKDENSDKIALKGAAALVKFGQYSRALDEFKNLLSNEKLRLDVAKNIIRCHVALDALKEAVLQYRQWACSDLFSPEQLKNLRALLQGILDKKGISEKLPEIQTNTSVSPSNPSEPDLKADSSEISDEEVIDISSVGITLADSGQTLEYDISFQSGTMLNLIVSDRDYGFLNILKPGIILDDVQFYSPIAMFNGEVIVASISQIESGPKEGYYSVDIKIKSI